MTERERKRGGKNQFCCVAFSPFVNDPSKLEIMTRTNNRRKNEDVEKTSFFLFLIKVIDDEDRAEENERKEREKREEGERENGC